MLNAENYTKIDGAALKEEALKIYKTQKSFCDAIGRSEAFLGGVVKRGSINPTDIKTIEEKTGISPDKYVIAEGIGGGDGMVRNLDVNFIRFKAHEMNVPLSVLCSLLEKKDNYLGNLRVNGATRQDFDRLCMILKISPNDERLIKKDKTIEEAEPETVNNINNKIHLHESKIADLYTKIKKLEAENAEIKRQLEGSKRLAGSIVGSLAKEGIQVGKEKEAKQ